MGGLMDSIQVGVFLYYASQILIDYFIPQLTHSVELASFENNKRFI